jgi:hypothetical protein
MAARIEGIGQQNAIPAQAFPAIVRALLGDPVKGLSTAKDWRYGRKGGLSVNVARGLWYAHNGAEGGGLFDLVVHCKLAKDRAGAAEWLKAGGWLDASSALIYRGETLAQKVKRQEIEAKEVATKRACALTIWEASEPLTGSPAYTYLTEARCIPEALLEGVTALRFHSKAPLHPNSTNGLKYPAMVAKVVGPDGGFVGVHITYLASDGSGKADLPTCRKFCGAGFMAGSVRLGDGPQVVVAEGVESAFSVGGALGLSSVAALSAAGVKAWRAWSGVSSVAFAPDIDVSGIGMAAARSCAERLHVSGVKVTGFAIPPNGHNDWNDAARAGLLIGRVSA